MKEFTIGIKNGSLDMDNFIDERIVDARANGIYVEQKKSGDLVYIHCSNTKKTGNELTEGHEAVDRRIKSHLADFASEIIIHHIHVEMMEKIIQDEYFYFDKTDRKKIMQGAISVLWKCRGGEGRLQDIRLTWHNRIRERVLEHFETNTDLLIEGFVRFRLKDLLKEVQHAIDRSVRELLIEKEYNDFIKLLRYFVEIQQPKLEEVHVFPLEDKKYTLMDDRLSVIDNEFLEDMAKEMSNIEIDQDDLLISSLITIAPNRITIHDYEKIKNIELLNTINKVFRGKVTMSRDGMPPT
jgi:putative sporulation protein YtxC